MPKRTRKKTPSRQSAKRSTRRPARAKDPLIQLHLEDHQLAEVWSIFLLLSALFIFSTFQFPDTTGYIGQYLVNDLGFKVFGQTIRYSPLFLLFGASSLLIHRSFKDASLKALGIGYLVLSIFFEMIDAGFPTEFARTTTHLGGGIIGHTTLFLLHKLVGPIGTKIVLAGSGLLASLFVFKLSFYNLLRDIVSLLIEPTKNSSKPTRSSSRPSTDHELPSVIKALFFKRVKETPQALTSRPPMDSFTSAPKPPESPSIPLELELLEPSKNEPTKPMNNKEKNSSIEIITPTEIQVQTPQPLKPRSVHREESGLGYQLPPLSLLEQPQKSNLNQSQSMQRHQEKAKELEEALQSFKVDARVVNVTPGPTVTRYELQPGKGVKISKITNLANDIALKLAAQNVRIQAPIPGKSLVGIEVPNEDVQSITLRQVTESTDFFERKSHLLAGMGVTITGEPIIMDVGKMPHVLIAGATGSGKSVCINTIITSILMRARPDEVKFLMIDPKKVELSLYNNIPHLLAPVVSNPNQAAAALKSWALQEMERRYTLFSKARVKTLDGYNKRIEEIITLSKTDAEQAKSDYESFCPGEGGETPEEFNPQKIPYIVVIIDELADLMMVASKDVETTICRLAQMARATGIHLVIATQRPSVNVITGLIKANIPSRISFFLQSQIDSRTVLDMAGAEKLLGKGDMLYSPVGTFKPIRAQGVYLSEKEIKAVVKHVKSQAKPTYLMDLNELELLDENGGDYGSGSNSQSESDDELYEQAKEIVINTQYASTSYLQRKLRIGYNRAARIMDELRDNGIVEQYATSKSPRTN